MSTQNYFVTWEIDIEAESPVEAARRALEIHRDPESIATIFIVKDEAGDSTTVDLTEIEDTESAALVNDKFLEMLKGATPAALAQAGKASAAFIRQRLKAAPPKKEDLAWHPSTEEPAGEACPVWLLFDGDVIPGWYNPRAWNTWAIQLEAHDGPVEDGAIRRLMAAKTLSDNDGKPEQWAFRELPPSAVVAAPGQEIADCVCPNCMHDCYGARPDRYCLECGWKETPEIPSILASVPSPPDACFDEADYQTTAEDPLVNPWSEDPEWSRDDWKYDVINGDTNLGYWDWVEHNKESEAE
jgi:hypothetical protein